MSFLNRLKIAFSRFMIGRYGTDTLNRHLLLFWLFIYLLNFIFHSLLLYILGLCVCAITFFRMFSRNAIRRQRENAAYWRLYQKNMRRFKHVLIRFRDRKTTRFFKCPYCKAPIRMPRRIGKFNIRCQKCSQTFQKEFKR